MDIGDWIVSPNCVLNEQVAKELFDILPERGPIMVIMDREGNRWVSDPERFSKMSVRESFWSELCVKIDDGAEPVVTQVDDCGVVAAQLATEQSRCGYVVVILSQYSPESTLINISLIETILNQAGLITKLIEKNNALIELQRKKLSTYTQNEASSN